MIRISILRLKPGYAGIGAAVAGGSTNDKNLNSEIETRP